MAEKESPPNVTLLRPKLKDPKAAARSRRYRRRRRNPSREIVTLPEPVLKNENLENLNEAKSLDVVSRHAERDGGVTVSEPISDVVSVTLPRPQRRTNSVTVSDAFAMMTAVGLASIAGYFSVSGMVVLFPGKPVGIVIFGTAVECGKLATAAWLARHWASVSWLTRIVLASLILMIAGICAAGVYSQLIAAHVGERGAAQSAVSISLDVTTTKIAAQQHVVADIDRRLGQIDSAIEEATKRGRTKTALDAMESQRRLRAGLVDERKREATTL